MEKKIPTKNYIILFVIVSLTVIGVFYARGWYNTTKEYYSRNSVMKEVVSEIKEEEIQNYSLESPNFVLYVSSGRDSLVKPFENNFKNIAQKLSMQKDILYLNVDGVDKNSFINNLKNNFSLNNNIANKIITFSSATIYIFEEGKISKVLNNVHKYSNKQIESILGDYGMMEND